MLASSAAVVAREPASRLIGASARRQSSKSLRAPITVLTASVEYAWERCSAGPAAGSGPITTQYPHHRRWSMGNHSLSRRIRPEERWGP